MRRMIVSFKAELQTKYPIILLINNYKLLKMAQLNIPPLSLFKKSEIKTKLQSNILKQTPSFSNLNHLYAPAPAFSNPIYHPYMSRQQQQFLLTKTAVKQEYLKSYYDTLRKQQLSSYPTSDRCSLNIRSSRNKYGCQCQHENNLYQPSIQTKIARAPYISNHYTKKQQFREEPKKQQYPSKNVYLQPKKPERQQVHQHSIINNISPSLLRTEKNISNINNINAQRMINDSNVLNTNQSLMVDIIQPPKPENYKQPIKKQTIQQQIQTDQAMNRSSFVFGQKKVNKKMDEANFNRAIRDLQFQLNNIDVDLSGEDIIIDLSELTAAKKQYIQDSELILKKLKNLAEQQSIQFSELKSKKQGGIQWHI